MLRPTTTGRPDRGAWATVRRCDPSPPHPLAPRRVCSATAFESIEHVGHFGGGGGSGVGGCDRPFVLTQDVDVLQHYRVALPEAGWQVIEDGRHHLHAERDGMAFEVITCGRSGVVWAGRDGDGGGARCDQQ
jgi:hypothetical protein